MNKLAIIVLLSWAVIAYARADVTITPTKDGLQVVGASDKLQFTLEYPIPTSADFKKEYVTKEVAVKDNTATIKYRDGGEVDLAVDQTSGIFTVTGLNMPADVKFLVIKMPIDISFYAGGTYQFDDKETKPFPETQPPGKPQLFSGIVTTCTIRSSDGKGIKISDPGVCYQQMDDMRRWKWPVFLWRTFGTYDPQSTLSYRIEDAGAPPTAATSAATTNAAPAKP